MAVALPTAIWLVTVRLSLCVCHCVCVCVCVCVCEREDRVTECLEGVYVSLLQFPSKRIHKRVCVCVCVCVRKGQVSVWVDVYICV